MSIENIAGHESLSNNEAVLKLSQGEGALHGEIEIPDNGKWDLEGIRVNPLEGDYSEIRAEASNDESQEEKIMILKVVGDITGDDFKVMEAKFEGDEHESLYSRLN